MSQKQGVIVMSAILPTTGHIDLIRFAVSHADLSGMKKFTVIVNTRPHEPGFLSRGGWIRNSLELCGLYANRPSIDVKVINDCDADAFQNPGDVEYEPDFWDFWANKVETFAPGGNHVVYASEQYGEKLALALGGDFVPYDIARSLNYVQGTATRRNLPYTWANVAIVARQTLAKRVTIFGQESVGKTTMVAQLKAMSPSSYTTLHEFARPYLESVGPDLTHEKMKNILYGQAAIQIASMQDAKSPAIVMDTDVMSTFGYCALKGYHRLLDEADDIGSMLMADLYVVMPDDIPFEVDPLRFGGDKRESSTEFWIELLEDVGANYIVVPRGISQVEKLLFVHKAIQELISSTLNPFIEFTRD